MKKIKFLRYLLIAGVIIFVNNAYSAAIRSDSDEEFRTALQEGNLERMREYLNSIDVNATDSFGSTMLMRAVTDNLPNVVRMLLEYNETNPKNPVNVNATDRDGHDALMIAVIWNRYDIVEMLLKYNPINHAHRVDVNKQNNHGNTALALAVFNANQNIVGLLLNDPFERVNPEIIGPHGITYLMYSILAGNAEMVRVMTNTENRIKINVNAAVKITY